MSQTSDRPFHDVITLLEARLGSKLVTYLSGSPDRSIATKWRDGTVPLANESTRLRFCLDIHDRISAAESPEIADQFFTGANYRGNVPLSILELIRADKFDAVTAAADDLLTDQFA